MTHFKLNTFDGYPIYLSYPLKTKSKKHFSRIPHHITLCSIEEIKVNDTVSAYMSAGGGPIADFKVVNILERRDCKGIFENPEHAFQSFYKIEVEELL